MESIKSYAVCNKPGIAADIELNIKLGIIHDLRI